jgi:DNA-3-methyladenine glycosylase
MRLRRGNKPDQDLCNGPGKLTEGLGVDLSDNETDLSKEPFLLTAPPEPLKIITSPRIGITKAIDRPWRFSAANNPYVSRPRPTTT